MILRQLSEAYQTERCVTDPKGRWESIRLLLKDDQMGFSLHITTVFAGGDFAMHYQHHLEAVYCISGEGEISQLKDSTAAQQADEAAITHAIKPGTLYALDQHDKHQIRAITDMQMLCVFNPALSGKELHNAEGGYEPVD